MEDCQGKMLRQEQKRGTTPAQLRWDLCGVEDLDYLADWEELYKQAPNDDDDDDDDDDNDDDNAVTKCTPSPIHQSSWLRPGTNKEHRSRASKGHPASSNTICHGIIITLFFRTPRFNNCNVKRTHPRLDDFDSHDQEVGNTNPK